MHQPVFGKEPTENTEYMMFFNDEYLYVGAELHYPDISSLSDMGRQRLFMVRTNLLPLIEFYGVKN